MHMGTDPTRAAGLVSEGHDLTLGDRADPLDPSRIANIAGSLSGAANAVFEKHAKGPKKPGRTR